MAHYRSTCHLRRTRRSDALLLFAYVLADYLAPVLCRMRLHLWDDDNRCVECGKPC